MQMMEMKDILFTGIGRAMSDLDANDGELSVSHNIINDNGAMRPIWVPDDIITLQDGEELVYVHRTSGYKNYIVRKSGTLFFFTDNNSSRSEVKGNLVVDESLKVSSMGNTLILTSGNGLEYVLYSEGSYRYIGQKPPELNIKFGLKLSRLGSAHDYAKITATGNLGNTSFDEEYRNDVSLQISAKVNEVLAKAESSNHFTSTFYVRWAYRMYGGLYMASPPVMMPINAGIGPLLEVLSSDLNGIYTPSNEGYLDEFRLNVFGYKGKLQYEIPYYSEVMKSIEDWKDIIDGVEIYVTRGTTAYNQDGVAKGIVHGDDSEQCVSYGSMNALGTGGEVYARRFGKYLSIGYYVDGMHKTEEEYKEELLSNGVFYKLKSYSVDELESGIVDVELEEKTVSNLATSSVLGKDTDEYLEHDILYPEGLHVYNGRLNLYGVESEKYNFPLYSLSANTDGVDDASSALVSTFAETDLPDDGESGDTDTGGGVDGDISGGSNSYIKKEFQYNVRFVINNEGQSVNVTNIERTIKMYEPPLYLFYPDNSARKAIIERYNSDLEVWEQAEVTLTSHPNLQGCYWFGGFDPLTFKEITDDKRLVAEPSEERRVNNSGKIYTSEVNNPFIFPLGGINTIGTGRVVGISTVTKALSQGQFGQFPLYVFSTEGVWAMEVGSNGLYSSIKPVSRDVCINGESITQTDDAVLFVTEQGVMYLDGSNVVSISDMMNGRSLDVESIYGLGGLMKDGLSGSVDFVDYARTARMAYDYANSRILLYREDMKHCYVFSMTTKVWATLGMEIENAVTDYPDVYVQKGSGVKNLSTRVDYDSKDKVSTLIVTRPLKFGDDGFKTVYETVARGAMDRREGAVLLWGSHDGMEYVLIKAVRGNRIYRTSGSGYRYFRIGVVGNMNPGETLSVISVGLRRKYQNRLR